MSFWDDVGEIGDEIGDIPIVGDLLRGIPIIGGLFGGGGGGGSGFSIAAQLLAAKLAVQANERAQKIMQEAVAKALEARRAGNEEAARQYEAGAARAIATITGTSEASMAHIVNRAARASYALDTARGDFETGAGRADRHLVDYADRAGSALDTARGDISSHALAAAGMRQAFNEQASERFDPIVEAGDMSRDKLLQIAMTDPGSLTPGQAIMLGDLARHGEATAAAGGLRGAGRARAAMLDDTLGRSLARFFDINRARSDAALRDAPRTGLEGRAAQAALLQDTGRGHYDANLWAGGNLADIEGRRAALEERTGASRAGLMERLGINLAGVERDRAANERWAGSNLAGITERAGRDIGGIHQDTGAYTAGLAHDTGVAEHGGELLIGQAGAGRRLADADVYGTTIGAIAGTMAEDRKRRAQEGRYGTPAGATGPI